MYSYISYVRVMASRAECTQIDQQANAHTNIYIYIYILYPICIAAFSHAISPAFPHAKLSSTSSTAGLEHLRCLQYLDVAHNQIATVSAMAALLQMPSLLQLVMEVSRCIYVCILYSVCMCVCG